MRAEYCSNVLLDFSSFFNFTIPKDKSHKKSMRNAFRFKISR